MVERLIAPVLKTGNRATCSGVRIPLSPPFIFSVKISNNLKMIDIVYANNELLPSFHQALDQVAKEQIYIELTEAPPLEQVSQFQRSLFENNLPVFYAVDDGRVVGWVDITPYSKERLSHRGLLARPRVGFYIAQQSN